MRLPNQILASAFLAATLAAGALAQTTETVTYSYSGYPIPILTDDADVISVAGIIVPRALKMTKVTAKVNIGYPQVGDLDVFLYSPDGTRVKLLEGNCGSLRNVDTTFDDAAPQRFGEFCPAEAGRGPFRGNEPLSNFNNADSSIGLWVLAVENSRSGSRAGWLNAVSLTVTGTVQTQPYFRTDTVLNSANGRFGVVSPGQVVSIAGTSLGPIDGVFAPAGAWPATLGGVRVTVAGTDVPIRYASSFRVDVQMPFNLPTGQVPIQIFYNNNTSAVVNVTTQSTFPGVFAVQSGGAGQAKAVNQNGTLNSVVNPADRGSVVTVYAIGLGAVSPAVTAGQVPPSNPLSLVSNPVAASIGGVPATVLFAGLAPGYPGLYQVNLAVPAGAAAGTQELILSNAGNASQSGLTIQVR